LGSGGQDDNVVVEYAGSKLRVTVTSRGAFKCPLCNAVFFSERDLVSHIISHAMDLQSKRRQAPRRY